jgi:hypothetical protein
MQVVTLMLFLCPDLIYTMAYDIAGRLLGDTKMLWDVQNVVQCSTFVDGA